MLATTGSYRAPSDDDTILGKGGKDRLEGRGDDDRLDGGKGKDKLFGNDDDDVLDGGRGTTTA